MERDLCKTPPFAQFRRQAQILSLEILNVFLRLKFSPSLNLNKIEHFSKVSEQVARDTTILVVAHRLSTIAKADQVYVMQQGRVFEEGAFKVLSTRPGSILNDMIAVQQPLVLV